MSKQMIKKFRKNDYSHDDEEGYGNNKIFIDKRKEKRVERALKTKDISALIEDEDDDFDDFTYEGC